MEDNMESHKYDDIINMPRPQSPRRKMTLHERAAQFSPFAALTGYEEAVKEAARLTDSRPEPDEDRINELNAKIGYLKTILSRRPEITVTYFIPDARKAGGLMEEFTGNIRVIDEYERQLVFESGNIPIDDVYDITGSIFDEDEMKTD